MAKIFLHSSVSSLNPDFSNANPAFSSCVLHTCGQTLETIDGRCLKINNIVFAAWSSSLCIVQLSPIERIGFNHQYEISNIWSQNIKIFTYGVGHFWL